MFSAQAKKRVYTVFQLQNRGWYQEGIKVNVTWFKLMVLIREHKKFRIIIHIRLQLLCLGTHIEWRCSFQQISMAEINMGLNCEWVRLWLCLCSQHNGSILIIDIIFVDNFTLTNTLTSITSWLVCTKKYWSNPVMVKSVILGRGSSYKDLIFFGLKSKGGGSRLAEISILASYKAKLY